MPQKHEPEHCAQLKVIHFEEKYTGCFVLFSYHYKKGIIFKIFFQKFSDILLRNAIVPSIRETTKAF